MLENHKLILEKVSFDSVLFEKELTRSIRFLLPEETQELISWVKKNFHKKFPDLISDLHNFVF